MHYVVYTGIMKNITLSAQEEAIEKARQVATANHSTLNQMFRQWLATLAKQPEEVDTKKNLESLWLKTNYVRVGKKLSRDEMNQR